MLQRRLVVWTLETLCEIPLLAVLLILLSNPGQGVRWFDIHFAIFGVVVFMVASGFVFTTVVAGTLIWRQNRATIYPLVAAALYLAHAQLFLNGLSAPERRQVLLLATGALVVFACTFVGGRFLTQE